jgi:ATP-dependent DNA helicase RecQ
MMKLTCPKCKHQMDAPAAPSDDRSVDVQCPACGAAFVVDLTAQLRPPQADAIEPPLEYDARHGPPPEKQQPAAAAMEINDPYHVLKKYFGYHDFRPNQLDIIQTLLSGKDVFVLMPTGSGKSICYQIPAIMRPGVGIIISPLIALMQDQVQALRQIGVRAAYLNSTLSARESAHVKTLASDGGIDLLYVAPERLLSEAFQESLSRWRLSLFAIDEAHCVSQWGHDFRPEYLGIANVTRRFKAVPRIALTATADRQTREGILANLELTSAKPFVSSFDRPNIRYRIGLKNNDKNQLLTFLTNEHPHSAGIVYVRTRKRADTIAQWLSHRGIEALPYHAGLDPSTRFNHQKRFLQQEGLVMVATIAFGMGIDKPDVRFVAHLDLPASVEAYYQETGRAGRDGQPADAWMVYSLSDVIAMRKMMAQSDGDEAFKRIQFRKLEALLGFGETVECRRKVLLEYFGETGSSNCGNCDTCLQPVETWDGTIAAQMALSCIYRTGERFGAAYLTDVLTGRITERIKRFGHDRIKTFAVGRELSSLQWRSVFRQLAAAGLVSVNLSEISGFRLTKKSWPVLKGERPVELRKDPEPVRSKKRTGVKQQSPPARLPAADQPLWEAMRELRLSISKELGIPPYIVFHDRTLKEMVRLRPTNRNELLLITGVGEKKADQFGTRFLELINADDWHK